MSEHRINLQDAHAKLVIARDKIAAVGNNFDVPEIAVLMKDASEHVHRALYDVAQVIEAVESL